ncbi:putative WD repeat-containing protein [Naja naja]|nr:putative WD repeat-containing protein [Naja naja]
MAAEGGGKEMNEIKTQFTTREGLYKLLSHSEYSRPNRVPFNSQGSNPVRVSFVNVNDQSGNGDRLCFNVGRELYFYIYKGVRKVIPCHKKKGIVWLRLTDTLAGTPLGFPGGNPLLEKASAMLFLMREQAGQFAVVLTGSLLDLHELSTSSYMLKALFSVHGENREW